MKQKKNLSATSESVAKKSHHSIKKAKTGSPIMQGSFDIPSYIGLGLVLLLIFIIRSNFLNIPFERDEGSYVYSGKIILDGAKTYIDIGSQRLDGVFYVYALLVAIFGYSIEALHLAFLVLNICTTVMVFFLTRKLCNSLAGFAAAAFFSLLSMNLHASGFTIQSEHIVAFFIVAAFLSLFHFFDSENKWLLLLSGVLFSVAFQVKQTSFFYVGFAGLILVFRGFAPQKENIKNTIILVGIFCFSFFIPLLIDLFIVYKNGAWADFNIWFFDIRKQYTGVISFDKGFEQLLLTFENLYHNYKLFWTLSLVGTIIAFFTSLVLWKKIAIAGLWITGFLTVVPGFHFYGHYFLQWIPIVSMTAGICIFSVQDIFKNKFLASSHSLYIALFLLIYVLGTNMIYLKKYYFNPNNTNILREVYGLNPFPESKVIADKLNSMMHKDDKLAVFGTETQMYVYTNKKSPSRFAGSGALLEFPVSQSKAWQQEFISDVEKSAPEYLVFFSHAISWMVNAKSENLIFPWFNKFSNENYKLIGFADIYSNQTNYVWETDIDMRNNPPKSEYKIYIFRKK